MEAVARWGQPSARHTEYWARGDDAEERLLYSGWLTKKGHIRRNHKKRFFLLTKEGITVRMSYFSDDNCSQLKGQVTLHADGQSDLISVSAMGTQKYPHGIKLVQGMWREDLEDFHLHTRLFVAVKFRN
jgi:hypothetical protein